MFDVEQVLTETLFIDVRTAERIAQEIDPYDLRSAKEDLLSALALVARRLILSAVCRMSVSRSSSMIGAQPLFVPGFEPSVRAHDHSINIFQFWDTAILPDDVARFVASWAGGNDGWTHKIFSDEAAQEFISDKYDAHVLELYKYCHHPAMKADLFRLLHLNAVGGIYVDADDVCLDRAAISSGIRSDLLYVTSYAIDCIRLYPIKLSTSPEMYFGQSAWQYFNNNFISAPAGHPAIRSATESALRSIGRAQRASRRCDIHEETGPGLLTNSVTFFAIKSLLDHNSDHLQSIVIVPDHERLIANQDEAPYKAVSNWRDA